jgi:hypothetical protein
VGALLIYGDEPDAVRELASRAVKKVAGSLDDPFSVMTLAEQDLASDPARLADEVQSISMFGGRKAIWVKECGRVIPQGRAAGAGRQGQRQSRRGGGGNPGQILPARACSRRAPCAGGSPL